MVNGIWEFPITFFSDWPGHFRHAELCACSSDEMEEALLEAWRRRWYSFVIVTHTSELIDRKRRRADYLMIRRFRRLCQFLEREGDRFETSGFANLREDDIPLLIVRGHLRGRLLRTAGRYAEQLLRRLKV